MYNQIKLDYDFDALQPHIDALTMETHYTKHHSGYTKNLNEAALKAQVDQLPIEELLMNLDKIEDENLRIAIRNNGGGYYNHNLYFSLMSPDGKRMPDGKLALAINQYFESFEQFKEQLTKLALGQFGSGWAWLSADETGKLFLSASPNQDNPLIEHKKITPILGIDVWEHAYYLKYKNLRANYVKEFFNVIDWDVVADNYQRVLK